MQAQALILRRCYPVPVTFADLRAAYDSIHWHQALHRTTWNAALKEVTSAIDEVYAVVDGREVRVATTSCDTWRWLSHDVLVGSEMWDLLRRADRDGYWERPHEVRLDLREVA